MHCIKIFSNFLSSFFLPETFFVTSKIICKYVQKNEQICGNAEE